MNVGQLINRNQMKGRRAEVNTCMIEYLNFSSHYRLYICKYLIRDIPALTFGHYGFLGESELGRKLA